MNRRVFILLILLVNTQILKGQPTLNELTSEEFLAISFNGVSLGMLMESKGDEDTIKKTVGEPVQIERYGFKSEPNIEYIYQGFNVVFSTQLNCPGNLSSIEVFDPTVKVIIKSHEFKVGDPFDRLKGVKYNTKVDGSKSMLFSRRHDAEFLSIDFNNDTGIIEKVTFIGCY